MRKQPRSTPTACRRMRTAMRLPPPQPPPGPATTQPGAPAAVSQVALTMWEQLKTTASTPSTVMDPEHPHQHQPRPAAAKRPREEEGEGSWGAGASGSGSDSD